MATQKKKKKVLFINIYFYGIIFSDQRIIGKKKIQVGSMLFTVYKFKDAFYKRKKHDQNLRFKSN